MTEFCTYFNAKMNGEIGIYRVPEYKMSDAAATLGHRVRVMEGLLKVDDYAGVATAAEAALGDLSVLSNVALMRGKALLNILLKKLMNGDDEDETSDEQTDVLREPLVMILLALSLDPESAAAKSEAETLRDLFPILGMKVPADLEEDPRRSFPPERRFSRKASSSESASYSTAFSSLPSLWM